MIVNITEPAKFPSDNPVNVEMKEHRKAYLVSFDPQLLVDRIVLLEARLWEAQKTMSFIFDYPPENN